MSCSLTQPRKAPSDPARRAARGSRCGQTRAVRRLCCNPPSRRPDPPARFAGNTVCGKYSSAQSSAAACRRKFGSGLPPDVWRGFASPFTCKEKGLYPSYGLWPKTFGASPNVGRSPSLNLIATGEAEPRRTSGGKPLRKFAASRGGTVETRRREIQQTLVEVSWHCRTGETYCPKQK